MTDIFAPFGAPQKALHLHLEEAKKSPKHLGHEYMIFEKYDGWFMYVDCIDGVWQGIRSKTGRRLPSMAMYDRHLAAGPKPNQDIRIIFEAIIPGKIFAELNGMFNQQQYELTNARLMCHDILYAKYPHTIFSKRFDRLASVVSFLNYDWLWLAPLLTTSADTNCWMDLYRAIVERDGEGIIAKKADAPYAPNKRDFTLMKIKRDLTLDVKVVGMVEGKGKYAGTLGALVVEEKSGQRHEVSGMGDEARHLWWNNRNLILGAIVEVEAMMRLPNGSLREGRFKAVRHDKTVEDID